MATKNEHYLYDAASFLDRHIPTAGDLVSLDNRLFNERKPLPPEGMSYAQRLRNLMARMPMQPENIQGPPAPMEMQIPAEMRAPLAPTAEGRGGYQIERAPQPMQPAPQTGNPVLDMFDLKGAPLPQMGQALGHPGQTFQGGIAPGVQSQIENVNNQTMQNATGKAQEAESMSDLGKMLRAYFGGRTKEEKQHDAFMNIAAGLAAGKSPRFMDNLGNAVSGAITYDRDADKGNKKEALDMMLKNQNLDDDRAYQQAMIALKGEDNDISRERVGRSSGQAKLLANYYGTAARQARSALAKIDPEMNPEAYALYSKQLQEAEAGYMAAVGGDPSGSGMAVAPAAPQADYVYDMNTKGGLVKTGAK